MAHPVFYLIVPVIPLFESIISTLKSDNQQSSVVRVVLESH